jgi:hypothetical protein
MTGQQAGKHSCDVEIVAAFKNYQPMREPLTRQTSSAAAMRQAKAAILRPAKWKAGEDQNEADMARPAHIAASCAASRARCRITDY